MSSRTKKIIITLVVVALAVIGLVLALLFQWANGKTAVTPEDFSALMEARGFELTDAAPDNDEDSILDTVLLARNGSYQLEYYDCISSEVASRLYFSNRYRLDEGRESPAVSTSISVGSYANYTLSSNGRYYHMARIRDTLIFIEADAAYEAEIKEIFSALGY